METIFPPIIYLARKRLGYEAQSAFGINCVVKLVGPRSIARSEGKAARVVDEQRL
jgi:phenylacetate-coenzyme A ligase PaaK-like adenylate-forming protein